MAHSIWKVLERKKLFETPRGIEIHVETVELPDGRVIDDFYTVEKPTASIIAAQIPDGRFIALRQYQHGPRKVGLTFPGGMADAGEDPLDAARRELFEETGYQSDDWMPLGGFHRDPTQGYGVEYFFHARNAVKTAEPVPEENAEELEVLLMDKAQLKAALFAGDVLAVPEAMIFAMAILL